MKWRMDRWLNINKHKVVDRMWCKCEKEWKEKPTGKQKKCSEREALKKYDGGTENSAQIYFIYRNIFNFHDMFKGGLADLLFFCIKVLQSKLYCNSHIYKRIRFVHTRRCRINLFVIHVSTNLTLDWMKRLEIIGNVPAELFYLKYR